MKIRLGGIAIILTLGVTPVIAADDVGPKDVEYCDKNHAQAVKACLAARKYYHTLIGATSLGELPKTEPARFTDYLTKEEREYVEVKEDLLIIAHAKGLRGKKVPVPSGLSPIRAEIERLSALPADNVGPKDTEYCNANHAQAVKPCLQARSYYNTLMTIKSMRELPEIPSRHYRYLTKDEKDKAQAKQEDLIK